MFLKQIGQIFYESELQKGRIVGFVRSFLMHGKFQSMNKISFGENWPFTN